MWKKGLALLVVCLVGFLLWHESSLEAPGGGKMYRVGILQLAEHPALDAANKGIVDGLREEGFEDNVIIDHQNAQGDQSNLNTIAQRFVARNSDLVVAIATPAVQAMANATKDIPVLGTAVTSYTTARLVDSDEHPGGNVSGTTDMVPMEKRVELVHQFVNTSHLATAYIASLAQYIHKGDSFGEIDWVSWKKKISLELNQILVLLDSDEAEDKREENIEPEDQIENLLNYRKKIVDEAFPDNRDRKKITKLTELKNLREILELLYDVVSEQKKIARKYHQK